MAVLRQERPLRVFLIIGDALFVEYLNLNSNQRINRPAQEYFPEYLSKDPRIFA